MHGSDNILLVVHNTKERIKNYGDGVVYHGRRKQGKEKYIKDRRYYFVDAYDSGIHLFASRSLML